MIVSSTSALISLSSWKVGIYIIGLTRGGDAVGGPTLRLTSIRIHRYYQVARSIPFILTWNSAPNLGKCEYEASKLPSMFADSMMTVFREGSQEKVVQWVQRTQKPHPTQKRYEALKTLENGQPRLIWENRWRASGSGCKTCHTVTVIFMSNGHAQSFRIDFESSNTHGICTR